MRPEPPHRVPRGWAPFSDPGSATLQRIHVDLELNEELPSPADDQWNELMHPTVSGTLSALPVSQLEPGP